MPSSSDRSSRPVQAAEQSSSSGAAAADGGHHELSFEALSQSFADLVRRAERNPASDACAPEEDSPFEGTAASSTQADSSEHEAAAAADDACPISPRTILEAALFVGHPGNHSLTSRQAAALMRGVSPREVDQLVAELNADYDRDGRPYRIESIGAGYRMTIRDEFASLRDKFYGRIREARLSQAAIDVLAIVAYNQPATRDQVERLRGKASGAVLSQLVRRQLLQIERQADQPARPHYRTTNRFLALFGLQSLHDLPQSQDIDRVL